MERKARQPEPAGNRPYPKKQAPLSGVGWMARQWMIQRSHTMKITPIGGQAL